MKCAQTREALPRRRAKLGARASRFHEKNLKTPERPRSGVAQAAPLPRRNGTGAVAMRALRSAIVPGSTTR